jgi:hypothetical protein
VQCRHAQERRSRSSSFIPLFFLIKKKKKVQHSKMADKLKKTEKAAPKCIDLWRCTEANLDEESGTLLEGSGCYLCM